MAWRLRACVARAVLRYVACAAGVSRRCGFSARWLTHGKLNCWRGAACRVVRCVCDAVSDGWHVSVAAPYISRMRRKRLEVDDGEWRCAAGHAQQQVQQEQKRLWVARKNGSLQGSKRERRGVRRGASEAEVHACAAAGGRCWTMARWIGAGLAQASPRLRCARARRGRRCSDAGWRSIDALEGGMRTVGDLMIAGYRR